MQDQGPFIDKPDDPQCQACGEEYHMDPHATEPTEFCHTCAQMLLPLFIEAATEIAFDIKMDSEMMAQSMWRKHLRALNAALEQSRAGVE